jgi:ligand-binding sensor domain-containing protein
MKILIMQMFFLAQTITISIIGQSSLLSNTESSPETTLVSDEKRNPLQKNTYEAYYNQHKFPNDCGTKTKSDYKMPANYVSNFVQMYDGQSYTGSKNGIIMWDNYAIIRITTDNSKIPENNITALALVDGDQLWIGTYNSGIVIGTGKDVKPFKIQAIQSHDLQVASISVDASGLVWVVYKNGGIECFLNGISCSYFSKD